MHVYGGRSSAFDRIFFPKAQVIAVQRISVVALTVALGACTTQQAWHASSAMDTPRQSAAAAQSAPQPTASPDAGPHTMTREDRAISARSADATQASERSGGQSTTVDNSADQTSASATARRAERNAASTASEVPSTSQTSSESSDAASASETVAQRTATGALPEKLPDAQIAARDQASTPLTSGEQTAAGARAAAPLDQHTVAGDQFDTQPFDTERIGSSALSDKLPDAQTAAVDQTGADAAPNAASAPGSDPSGNARASSQANVSNRATGDSVLDRTPQPALVDSTPESARSTMDTSSTASDRASASAQPDAQPAASNELRGRASGEQHAATSSDGSRPTHHGESSVSPQVSEQANASSVAADRSGGTVQAGLASPPRSIDDTGTIAAADRALQSVPESVGTLDRSPNEAASPVQAAAGVVEAPGTMVTSRDVVIPQPLGGLLPLTIGLEGNGEFEFDRSVLRPDVKPLLDRLAEKLASADYDRIDIVGYTDRIGTPDYNQYLSERRAWAVARYLIEVGVPQTKLHVEGRGMRDPLTKASDCPFESREQLIPCLQKDRRVEISASIRRADVEVH